MILQHPTSSFAWLQNKELEKPVETSSDSRLNNFLMPLIQIVKKMIIQTVKEGKPELVNRQSKSSRKDEEFFAAYKDEINRLGALKDATEDIWEDRTYQMAAGGLSLTFAVFSFLMGKDNGIPFSWPMAVIWGGFVFCLVANYLSQHIAKNNFIKLQDELFDDREKQLPYDEKKLIERNRRYDQRMNLLNIITEVVLVADIIGTIVFCIILFCN